MVTMRGQEVLREWIPEDFDDAFRRTILRSNGNQTQQNEDKSPVFCCCAFMIRYQVNPRKPADGITLQRGLQ
ncbi:MAG: hypothetical protein R2912_08185 [Eubacteriales bacterium]